MPVGFVVTSPHATEIDKLREMTAPVVFDRALYALRRLRAEEAGTDSFLVSHAAENLCERLGAVKRQFDRALDLGSRRQSFDLMARHGGSWIRSGLHPLSEAVSLVADDEVLPFAYHSLDLIVSVLGLHAVNDLPGVLVQIRRALAPGGLFMAALFGGATLNELRKAFVSGEAEVTGGAVPRVAPFADVRDMGALLQRAGFTAPVADVDRLQVRYVTLANLVNDLRAIGETNALERGKRRLLSRRALPAALDNYRRNDGSEGKLAATFDILYVTGWAPDAG